MSLPTRNFWHQSQEQVTEEEEENRYRHVHNKQNPNHLVPVSKYEVAELTWEKGNLNMHRLGGIVLNDQTKQTFGRASDTLESIVHQATSNKQNYSPSNLKGGDSTGNIATSSGQWRESSAVKQQTTAGLVKKRMRSDSDPQLYGSGRSVGECSKNIVIDQQTERSANCASDRDNDTTMITWPCSLDESSRSFKSKANEDSGWHGRPENKEKEHETKGSNPSKRNRTAAVHNQSERRRRDRINEKLKTLQKMVPNASKTDKASMLDEVIKYLKLLQTEVQLISSARNMEYSQMMMMQPHIQMPLLARMGMNSLGMAPGMLNMAALARAATPHQSLTAPFIYPTSSIATSCPPFMSPAFAMAPTVPTPPQASGDACANKAAVAPSATNSFPFNDPYSAFLAQSMNMEFNNEMAAQYLQQANQSMHTRSKKLNQGNFNQGQTSDEKSRI